MGFTFAFVEIFLVALYLAAPLLLSFCVLIILVGQIVGRIEGWSGFDAAYWSFITALTVGYGDIRPSKRSAKTLSVAIAFTGIMFTGIVVALTLHAASKAFESYVDVEKVIEIEEKRQLKLR